MKLRDMAMAWIRANCPALEVQKDFESHFDHAIQRTVSCSFTVGSELTRNGKPYLISCFGGEFFVFQLTPRQVARLGMNENMMVCAKGARLRAQDSIDEPTVWLDEVTIDNANSLSYAMPITGSLRFHAKLAIHEPVSVRVDFELFGPGTINLIQHLPAMSGKEGSVRFSLQKLGDLPEVTKVPFRGVVPLFFQIWAGHPSLPPPPIGQATFTAPPQPQANRPDAAISRPASPFASNILRPESTCYPLTYDPGPQATTPGPHPKPISDIRAVLVEFS